MYRSHYRILGLIGQGQFGRVFCAVDRQTGEIVALKDLDLKRFPTHQFLREFYYLLTLRHPNIVACTGLEYNRTGRYLVMEYCEGGTLRDIINSQNRVSLGQKLNIVKDILAGLAHAHSRQIVHCDIKPENILLKVNSNCWVAHISDFGIARLIEELSNIQSGGYTGSPAYMAPERFYGKHSFASDLYSVGIILFELLVGERPFSGYPGELMAAHLSKAANIPDTVPPPLASIIEIAMRKLPQRRFKSANEMLQTLNIACENLGFNSSYFCFFLPPSAVNSYSIFNIIHKVYLPEKITDLSVEGEYVYLGMNNKLCCQYYPKSSLVGDPLSKWQVNIEETLVKLYSHPQGCITITKSLKNKDYFISYFPKDNTEESYSSKVCLSGVSEISAVAPGRNWLAAAFSESSKTGTTLKILKLPNLDIIKTSISCPLPCQIIPLDSRHGLIVDSLPQKQETKFQLFSRRGHLLNSFTLSIELQSVMANSYLPYYLFALEARKTGLGFLINLKPLKLMPVFLEFEPDFILGHKFGFLLASHQGKVILLNQRAEVLGRFEIDEGINNLGFSSEFRLLIATKSKQKKLLALIDLEQVIANVNHFKNISPTLYS